MEVDSKANLLVLATDIGGAHLLSVGHANRIRVEPLKGLVPKWMRSLGSNVVALSTLCGEYGGPFGCMNDGTDIANSEVQDLKARIKRKHPNWSDDRVERVVNQIRISEKRSHLSPNVRRRWQNESQNMFHFLTTICATGNVNLILGDVLSRDYTPRNRIAVAMSSITVESIMLWPIDTVVQIKD